MAAKLDRARQPATALRRGALRPEAIGLSMTANLDGEKAIRAKAATPIWRSTDGNRRQGGAVTRFDADASRFRRVDKITEASLFARKRRSPRDS